MAATTPVVRTTPRKQAKQDKEAYTPFGKVVRDLLIEHDIVNGVGNANLPALAELLEGVHYETLRKAVTGEREPSALVMEAVAKALGEDPAELFIEYRILEAQRQFDPREVGVETALANLEAFANLRKRKR